MPNLHLDHVAIPVFDAEATHRFYAHTLGLPLIDAHSGEGWEGKDWLMMIFGLGDDRQLAFFAFNGVKNPGIGSLPKDSRHYAFSVASRKEQDAWRVKLRAANVDFWEEEHDDQTSIYFSDPNGHILEITTPASGGGTKPNADAARTVKAWIEKVSKANAKKASA
jgi:catechol 2,3-dioxygenase-like lactoylglutathione lyase family enzyme